LYRGQDGLLVFVLDLKLLKGSLQVPGQPVERLAGDLEAASRGVVEMRASS
jgi:hypothetical protein